MKITFILKDNRERKIEFEPGNTILSIAEKNGIPLHGNCEGFGVCGSCHVIIENFHEKLPKISDLENNALDNSNHVTLKSRLACQIVLDESMDGLRVRIAH